ncbi:hypothetical protein MLD38_012508 [Melastoma candidum]|uniref:Uncharacterized protein n=1 Tax=Melastoma candidum TaxID=119954 RepID=A0ACB9R751_9MYRT|nr:hypothetical protein MLD38_012508 [Melastoma candidum]
MPGNGVGDRDHNFFSQESFSQGQGRFEVVERSWPMLDDNRWAGNQRQSGYPFISNNRNAAMLQSDADRGPGTASFNITHGLGITQSNPKHGFTGSSFQNQQTQFNGFVQRNQVFPVVQNESNFLGMDLEPDQRDFSKGFPIVNSQRGKVSEVQRIPSKMLNADVAVNLDFLGAREPATNPHPGASKILQGQQTNVNDVQLLQQQVMLKQLQDVQRHQQQQQGIWQQSSLNQFSSIEKPVMPLNGIPVNDTSNNSWQHGFGASNSNRLQQGTSVVAQGSPGGLMMSPQHGQEFHIMGQNSQYDDPSPLGITLSKSRSIHNSQLQNSSLQRMPSVATSMPGNFFASSDQTHVQNGALVLKQIANASHSNALFNSDVFRQARSPQTNMSMAEIEGRQTYVGYSGTPERNTLASPAPQNEATLDPTEERILFGGDDNVWGNLGLVTSPVTGISDGTGLLTGFPSVQSGSWSALMQSALAETSSDNQGTQEEWSGLSVQNAETTVQISQPNILTDDPRQSALRGGSMHPHSSSSRPPQPSNDGRSATISDLSGAKQSDLRLLHGESEIMRGDSSPRWQLDRNHHQNQSLEGSQNYMSVANSSDSPAKKMSSGSFGHQPNIMNQKKLKALESKNVGDHSMSRNLARDNCVQTMSSRSPAITTSGTPASHGEDIQQLPRHHSFDLWRSGSSPMNIKGIPEDRNAPTAESSGNNYMYERGHENKRNFSGAFHPNSANYMTASAEREHAWLDAGGASNLPGRLPNQSGMESPYGIKQVATKPIISQTRGLGHLRLIGSADATPISSEKFQVDPKGTEAALGGMPVYASENLSVSVFTSRKNVQSSQNMLELLNKVDQSREPGVSSHLSSSERNENIEAETSDGSVGHFQQNQFPASKGFSLQLAPPSPRLQNINRVSASQNPLTLPGSHSLSQREMGHSSFVSSSSIQSLSTLRETPITDCGNIFGSSGEITNKTPMPTLQGGFSVAFSSGFPFTRSHPPNQLDTSANATVGPSLSVTASSNRIPTHSNFMDTSNERSEFIQSDLGGAPNIPTRASSVPPKADSGIANQMHSAFPPQQFPTSQSSTASSFPRQAPFSRVLPDAWMASSNQQHLLSAIPGNSTMGLVDAGPKYSNRVDMNSSELWKRDSVDLQNGGQGPSESNERGKVQRFDGEKYTVKEPSSEITGPSQTAMRDKETLPKPLSDVSNSSSGRQGKVEVFDGYLRPSNSMGNYALLHQVQPLKTSDGNLDDRAMKRMKGLDSSLDSQSVALEGGNSLSGNSCVPMESSSIRGVDSEMLHFSNRPGDNQSISMASTETGAFSKVESRGSSMAPAGFEQYGNLINGNNHNMYDARKMVLLKSMQQSAIFHKSADTAQIHGSAVVPQVAFAANAAGNLLDCSTSSAATGDRSLSDHIPPLEGRGPNFLWPSRKWKNTVPENLSWHKEVIDGIGVVREMGEAEVEWAKACNRLANKVDNESDSIEGKAPLMKPRRRLLLSTQLMQLLLRPSPAAFLRGDAVVNVENVVYCVTRKTLGDACNWISFTKASPSAHSDDEKTISGALEVSEKEDDQSLTKAVEYLVGKTRTLENELSRLDRKFSIADLRAECQDLDKFSIINRFAKFHGRGHAEGAGMTSSLDAAASLIKFCPQRYVTALPMPRNLPDRIQCLSL